MLRGDELALDGSGEGGLDAGGGDHTRPVAGGQLELQAQPEVKCPVVPARLDADLDDGGGDLTVG